MTPHLFPSLLGGQGQRRARRAGVPCPLPYPRQAAASSTLPAAWFFAGVR